MYIIVIDSHIAKVMISVFIDNKLAHSKSQLQRLGKNKRLQKPVISFITVLGAELHVTAMYHRLI